MAGITMAGQKCIAEIGKLPGPKICITMDELLLWPVLLWPDCTVLEFAHFKERRVAIAIKINL